MSETLYGGVDVARDSAQLAAVPGVVELLEFVAGQTVHLAAQAPERAIDLDPLQVEPDANHGQDAQPQGQPGETAPAQIIRGRVRQQDPRIGLGGLLVEQDVVGSLFRGFADKGRRH